MSDTNAAVAMILGAFLFYVLSVWGFEPKGGAPRWMRPVSAAVCAAMVAAGLSFYGWLWYASALRR